MKFNEFSPVTPLVRRRGPQYAYFFGVGLGGDVSHQSTSAKNSSGVDQWTKNYMQGLGSAAQSAAAGGPGANLNSAGQFATNAQDAGNLGFGALSGNADQMKQLMNPYQQQVIDANNQQWQKTNQQGLNTVGDQAASAGAFGGGRQGIAEGTMLSNNAAAQGQQTANLLQQGYGNAQQTAMGLAQAGQQGAQLNANLGFGGVGNGMWGVNALKSGYIGPTGTNSDTETHQTGYGVNANASFSPGP